MSKRGKTYDIGWYFISLEGSELKARLLFIKPTVDDGVGGNKELIIYKVNGNSMFVSADGRKFLSNLEVTGTLIGQINLNDT